MKASESSQHSEGVTNELRRRGNGAPAIQDAAHVTEAGGVVVGGRGLRLESLEAAG